MDSLLCQIACFSGLVEDPWFAWFVLGVDSCFLLTYYILHLVHHGRPMSFM